MSEGKEFSIANPKTIPSYLFHIPEFSISLLIPGKHFVGGSGFADGPSAPSTPAGGALSGLHQEKESVCI